MIQALYTPLLYVIKIIMTSSKLTGGSDTSKNKMILVLEIYFAEIFLVSTGFIAECKMQ